MWQYVLCEKITFFEVRISAEDEGPHSHIHISFKFCTHLLRIPNDRTPATRSRQSDSTPKMWLEPKVGVYVDQLRAAAAPYLSQITSKAKPKAE